MSRSSQARGRQGITAHRRANPVAARRASLTAAAAAHAGNLAAASAGSLAVARTVSLTRTRGAMPAPMRGSLDSLERQNQMAESEGLERILDEDDLADRISHKLLVPVPVSAALSINGNLPEAHRYCRPWTAHFLEDLAQAHAAQFHQPLEISSAVRTVAYQKRLRTTNGNAAAAEGDVVSPHLTGATIDIAKGGLGRQEIGWMRAWLLPLQLAGKIDVEEEFRQACFHITVYKSYEPAMPVTSIAGAKTVPQSSTQAPAPASPAKKAATPQDKPIKTSRLAPEVAGAVFAHGR